MKPLPHKFQRRLGSIDLLFWHIEIVDKDDILVAELGAVDTFATLLGGDLEV